MHPSSRRSCADVLHQRVALVVLFGLSSTASLWGEGNATPDRKTPEVFTASRTFGPYGLSASALSQMFQPVMIDFDDPVWVLAYRTEIVGSDGNALADDLHCHTMLKTAYTPEWRDWIGEGTDTLPFRGLYTDGHTTEIRLPAGYGVYYGAGEPIMLQPMFNNRTALAFDAGMRVSLDYVLDRDLEEPLRPLFSTLQSVQPPPHLYYVEPGESSRETTFSFPYDGTIHAMAVHVHPYGKQVELVAVERNETVWTAVGEHRPDGTLLRMPVWTSEEGYAFRRGERFRMRVTYDNPTAEKQDAMGGIFFFFQSGSDRLPEPPRGEGG